MEPRGSSPLIRIGEFARLGGVSIKALRIYARLGLLRPAAVEPQSRYRLYARAQLSRLHRILMLKNAGLPLAQIGAQLCHRDESCLLSLRASLVSRAEDIRQQLAWVDAEIRAARDSADAVAPVILKHAPEMRVLSRRSRIDSYDEVDIMLRHVATDVPRAARLVSGAIWHDCGGKTGVIDCEVFWVLRRDLRSRETKKLAGATMASILHGGDESNIAGTYQAARRWMKDNHYEVIGPNREFYLGDSGTKPGASLIEVQFPVAKSS